MSSQLDRVLFMSWIKLMLIAYETFRMIVQIKQLNMY